MRHGLAVLGQRLGVLLMLMTGCADWWGSGQPEPIEYVVVSGDTLTKIGRLHGVEVAEIQAWNQLSGDRIDVGQILQIYPSGGAGEAAVSTPPAGQRRSARRTGGGAVPKEASTSGALTMPPPQACVPPPSVDDAPEAGDEAGYVSSVGLSLAQVKAGMDAALPTLGRCVQAGPWPEGSVELQLTVACTGQVAQVRVLDDGGLDEALVACVRDTLGFAAFPAHDLPDGFVFGYPLRFSAQ